MNTENITLPDDIKYLKSLLGVKPSLKKIVMDAVCNKYIITIEKNIKTYTRDTIFKHFCYIESHDAILSAQLFYTIFRRKYKTAVFIKNKEYMFTVPEYGTYYRKLDSKTFVVCTVSTITDDYFRNSCHTLNPTVSFKFNFIGINCFYWEKTMIKRVELLSKYFREHPLLTNDGFVRIYNSLGDGFFRRIKNIDDIILDNNDVIIKLDNFVNNANFYKKYNINYKTGVMVYGPTGTGKSSFAFALAKKYRANILRLTKEDIVQCVKSKAHINKLLRGIYTDIIVILIEEFDSLLSQESLNYVNDKDKVVSSVLRRDQLLGFIDDIPDNIILVATTNHIDLIKQDPALIRPGRFDIMIKMDNFDRDKSVKLLNKYDITDESFLDNYTFPLCPSELQRDIISNLSLKILEEKNDERIINL